MTQTVTNIGVHEKWQSPDYGRTPAEVMARFPGATIGRNAFIDKTDEAYPIDLRPAVKWVAKSFITADMPKVYVSIKTPAPDTRNGYWNSRYEELGEYVAAINEDTHATVVDIIPWHEPENDFSSGSAYAHYANKVRAHLKKGGGDSVNVGYCALSYQWSPNRPTTADPSKWREVEMDFYSIDVYSGRSYPLDVILPEHSGFTRWYDEIASYGSRPGTYRLTERGFETPSAPYPLIQYTLRNATITRELEWLRDSATGQLCEDYLYWNSSGSEESAGLLLDPSGEDELATWIATFFALNHAT